MKKLLAMALALLMVAVLLPVTALADTAAPSWVDDVDFKDAKTVYYYSTYGGTPYVKTTTDQDLSSHPAVIAYKTSSDSGIAYAADIRAALVNKAIEIYCKADSTISTVGAHANVLNDVTIYGNNANFQGGDLSIYADGNNYAAPESLNVTINIYNTKNLVVWGQPQAVDRTWNVNFYDCVNDGYNFFMYRGESDKTDKANLTMTNCKATGYADSIVHTTVDGSIVIKNCEFNNNCAPINIAHKQSGTITITIENSTFNSCGMVNPNDDYFAPVRFVNNSQEGTLDVTLTNNTFANTVGTNGDILLGDQRNEKSSFNVNAEIVTKQDVTVKSGNSGKSDTFKVKANTSVKANAAGEQPEVIRDNAPIIIYTPVSSPVFLSGANQTVAPGSAATFRIDKEFSELQSVAVDGVTLDKSNYKAWSGSTYVELTAAYMKTLAVGTHTLSVYFTGDTATTTFTISKDATKNPSTGSNDFVGVAAAAAVMALLGSAVVLRKK